MLTETLRVPAVRMPDLKLPMFVRAHGLSSIVLAVAAALYLFAGISVTLLAGPDGTANAKSAVAGPAVVGGVAPPAPEPLQFKKVDPKDALAINASVPIAAGPNPAAAAFLLRAGADDYSRSLACLTAAVYYEAATESVDGQRAVAQVVLNRLRHPAYPNSVCGVVFQGSERRTGCQFTFTCDGALARSPMPSIWGRAQSVAAQALAGYVYAPVGWATHYHTNWVVPYWSSSLVKIANVGTHIFYRWGGGWGKAPAFRDSHAGREPVLAKMGYLGFGPRPSEVELSPEQTAALVASGDLPVTELAKIEEEAAAVTAAAEPLPAVAYDPGALNRAIVRRFVPVKREDVAATLAKQTKPGAKVDESHRWAITGDAASSTGDSFGKPAEKPTS